MMLTRDDSESKIKNVYCQKLLAMKDRLAPIAYICIQFILLAPTVIRAQEDLLDLTQPFTCIFWASILLTLVAYFITHCADPGYVPLDLISLTENSQSSRIQQNGKRSFISQLFKPKSSSHMNNFGGESNKAISSQHKYDFKMESKINTHNDEEETKQKRQQKYLKHVMKQKNKDFVEFKDEEFDEEGEGENCPEINLDELKDGTDKTPNKNKHESQQNSAEKNSKSGNDDGNNNPENYVPECELTMEMDDTKQKSVQKSYKFEDSCQSGEKQDFVIGLQDYQGKLVSAFSPSESRNRSFEKNLAQNQNEQVQENKEHFVSIQEFEQDNKQVSQPGSHKKTASTNFNHSRKPQSEKQISLVSSDLASTNFMSNNSEKLISKEITTQIEDGSTKFTCKTTTQEQFTTQNLEKKSSPYHPCYKSEEAEEEEGSPVTKQSQNTHTISSNKSNSHEQNQIAPFQFEINRNDFHEIISNRDDIINQKDITFDKEHKHTNEDNMITDNDNDTKSQRKIKPSQTPVSQIIFFTNNSNPTPSGLFQFNNLNNLQNEKNTLKGEQKQTPYQEDRMENRQTWSKKKNFSKSGDLENQNNINSNPSDLNKFGKSIKIDRFQSDVQNPQMPFVEKRYCTSCYINMPLRAKHCKDCKRCVARFDHHCPYVGNCIGERNKCVFYWFLVLQLVELVVGFLEVLKYNTFGESNQLAYNIYTIFCFIVILFFFIFVLLLFVYHTYFGTRNITTWEYASWEKISYLSDIPYEFGSPFSMGFLKNCKSFCTFRLFQKEVTDPQYARFPSNLIELQNLRHEKETHQQHMHFFDLNNNNNDDKCKGDLQHQKNNTD